MPLIFRSRSWTSISTLKVSVKINILRLHAELNLCPAGPNMPCFANSVDPDQLASVYTKTKIEIRLHYHNNPK